MYNWTVNTQVLKKDKKQYTIWKLEQMVNFGLKGKKLNTKDLKKYWSELKLDPQKKRYPHLILWPAKQS